MWWCGELSAKYPERPARNFVEQTMCKTLCVLLPLNFDAADRLYIKVDTRIVCEFESSHPILCYNTSLKAFIKRPILKSGFVSANNDPFHSQHKTTLKTVQQAGRQRIRISLALDYAWLCFLERKSDDLNYIYCSHTNLVSSVRTPERTSTAIHKK